MNRALIALCTLLEASAASAGTVTFDVKQGGDVKWRGGCTADIYPAESGDAVKTGADTANPIDVDEGPHGGKFEAVIACDSDDGMVKQSVPFALSAAGHDVKVGVDIEPGFLLANVTRDNKPVSAQIAVFDERSRQVAASKDRAVIAVPSGKLKVLAKVDDNGGQAIYGNASATVTATQKSTVLVDTSDGELLVTLSDDGRKAGGVVALRMPGQKTRLIELRAGEKGKAPPGTYDLVTQLDDTHDFSEVLTKNVVIAPGKLTSRSVAHSTASIKVNVLVDGRAPPSDAKIDVELGNPGAAPFNTASAGDVLKVASGTFEIAAVRKDQARDDGTPPKATTKVSVHGGEARSVTLDIESAKLDVTTAVGGKPKSLDVDLYAPGNEVAIAHKTTDADGKATFTLAGGKLSARATLKAAQGDVVTAHDISLSSTSKLALKLNVDVGTAVVQVFEDGVAVPAEVRFFKSDGSAKPDAKGALPIPKGEPVLSVPAGQEALLPPGAYALVVVRNGDTHVFSDVKIASGRALDRTVELKAPK